ncbi:MAG: twin-arginine translocase TatA/TatE family subunit [Pirellulales bacterium]
MSYVLGIGMPGLPELLIIGAIVLLLFGSRLPSVMRSLGLGITEFKKGVQGIEEDVEDSSHVKSGVDHSKEKEKA